MPTETFFNLPADKRDRILSLAIDEFAAHDYNEASISRIVAQAGIAKGSFYQYFADKRDLYFYLLELAASEKRAFLSASAQPTEGFFAMLEGMFRAGLGFQFSNPKLAQIAYRAIYGDAPFAEESLAQMRAGSAAYFHALVEAAQAAGDIDPSLEPALVAFLLENLLNGFGDYLMGRMNVTPASLAAEGGQALNRPDYWPAVEELLRIMRRGLRPASVINEEF